MKNLFFILFCCAIIACNKSTVILTPLSTLEIVNTVPSSPGAQLFGNPNAVSYGSYGQFGLLASINAQIYIWPTGDSTTPYYNNTIPAVSGGIYSLYLIGSDKNDAILMKDTIPSYTDSMMGVRFINLSSDAGPLKVDFMDSTLHPLDSNLLYRSITHFYTLPGNSAIMNNGGYNFEFRDTAGNVLYTLNQSVVPFKNVTIVTNGLVADGSFSVFTVNNY